LLVNQAHYSRKQSDISTAQMFVANEPLLTLFPSTFSSREEELNLALGLDYQHNIQTGQFPKSVSPLAKM